MYRGGARAGGDMSHVWCQGWGVTWEPLMNRPTDMTEKITFPQFRWRAVKTLNNHKLRVFIDISWEETFEFLISVNYISCNFSNKYSPKKSLFFNVAGLYLLSFLPYWENLRVCTSESVSMRSDLAACKAVNIRQQIASFWQYVLSVH